MKSAKAISRPSFSSATEHVRSRLREGERDAARAREKEALCSMRRTNDDAPRPATPRKLAVEIKDPQIRTSSFAMHYDQDPSLELQLILTSVALLALSLFPVNILDVKKVHFRVEPWFVKRCHVFFEQVGKLKFEFDSCRKLHHSQLSQFFSRKFTE